jgi:hypothetical protein
MSDKDRLVFAESSIPCSVKQVDKGNETVELTGGISITVPLSAIPERMRERIEAGHSVRLSFAIESPHSRKEWSRAFALQGRSDLEVYRVLDANKALSVCHSLHYLQMASEKIAKAYSMRNPKGPSLDTLTKSHAGAPSDEFVKKYFTDNRATRFRDKKAQLNEIVIGLGGLAREINKLHPSVDPDKNPQNVEYPWSDGTRLRVPCKHTFLDGSFSPLIWEEFVETLDEASAELLKPS